MVRFWHSGACFHVRGAGGTEQPPAHSPACRAALALFDPRPARLQGRRSRGQEAGQPRPHTTFPARSLLMFDVRPSFIYAEVLSRVEASGIAQAWPSGRREINPVVLHLHPGPPAGGPRPSRHPYTPPHPTPCAWPSPSPPHRPGTGQDICHLWVLKCKSQQTLFPATFFLLDVPCIFQASRGRALSRGCRRSGHSGLQNTLGAQSQSQHPLSSLPRPPRLHNQATPFPPQPQANLQAQGHQHQERDYQPP